MATLNSIAREYADELREGIAWVIVWKAGRSWHATAVWLDPDTDTFEPYDLDTAREALALDPKAVMLNGYYCGHLGEDMTVAELADGIRWHYENGCNRLDNSEAFPPEPVERPADLPADIPWYGKETSAEPDPYVFDGCMSPEDYELMHKNMEADKHTEEPLSTTELSENVQRAFSEAAASINATTKSINEMTKHIYRLSNAVHIVAEDQPKWLHLCKHAKKARVRKKYRRRIMRQLAAKLGTSEQGGGTDGKAV